VLTWPGHFLSLEAMTSIALFSSLSETSFFVNLLILGLLSDHPLAERRRNRSACSSDIRPSIDFLESSLFFVASCASARIARE
jgi:hypothetical protein